MHRGINLTIYKASSASTGKKLTKFSHVLSFLILLFFMFFRLEQKKPCYVYLFFRSGNDGRKSLLSSDIRFNKNFVFFMLIFLQVAKLSLSRSVNNEKKKDRCFASNAKLRNYGETRFNSLSYVTLPTLPPV